MTEKNKGGRPEVELTSEQKTQVEALASFLTTEQIADYLGIGRTTFYSIMKRDEEVSERYKRGRARTIAKMGSNLISQANNGNVTATIFYLKTQAGWRETDRPVDDGAQNLNISFSVREPVGDVRVTNGED